MNIKKFNNFDKINEDLNTPMVNVGDMVKVVMDSPAPGSDEEGYDVMSKVQKVYPNGTILTDDRGHGVIARFDSSYNAWIMIEDAEEGDTEEYRGGGSPTSSLLSEENLEFFEGGDGTEYEVWKHKTTDQLYRVPIQIERYFGEAEPVSSGHAAKFGE